MYDFENPAEVLAALRKGPGALNARAGAARQDLQGGAVTLAPGLLEEAVTYLRETTPLMLNREEVVAIFALYPRIALDVGRSGSIKRNTEARDLVSDMVADFLLGSRWPQYGDHVDLDAFLAALAKAGKAVGYSVAARAVTVPRRLRPST